VCAGVSLNRGRTKAIPLLLVALLVVSALGLRLSYAVLTNPFIDEFASVWAGKLILQQGTPVTPAGVLYNHGLLFSYLEAVSIALLGAGKLATRLPSIFAGVVGIVVLYHMGKRLFSVPVGLLAATLLALSPETIMWAGRARMYALLQLTFLLAVYALYSGALQSKGNRLYMFAACFWAAVLAHFEAVLLYPAALLVLLVFKGRKWFVSGQGLLVNTICCLGLAAAYVIQRLGRSPDFSRLTGTASVVGGDLPQLWAALPRQAAFLLRPGNLPLTALFAMGLVYLLTYVVSGNAGRRALHGIAEKPGGWHRNFAFLYLVFCPIWLAIVAIGGVAYSNPRYVFMLLPVFFLIAAVATELLLAVVRWAWHTAERRLAAPFAAPFRSWPMGWLVVFIAAALYVPGAISMLGDEQPGLDVAMQYVSDRWSEGDAIMTPSPPAAAVHFGRCDYFTIQRVYEDYVVERDGELVDMWTGAPLLNSIVDMELALTEHQGVWLVADGERMSRRYEPDFLQYVVEQMQEIQDIEGVKVVEFKGLRQREEHTFEQLVGASFADKMTLMSYGLNGDVFQPGDQLSLSLRWQSLMPMSNSYSGFVHVVDANSALWAQHDGPPLAGLYPTTHWIPGEIVPDLRRIDLPADIPPGWYRLEMGVYQPESAEHLIITDDEGRVLGDRLVLDYVQVSEVSRGPFEPQHLMDANLGDVVKLWGYDVDARIAEAGDTVHLVLYWEARQEVEQDYTVFTHLIDNAGWIWGQRDNQPVNGFYPTSFWDEGDVIQDEYQITIDSDTPPGLYQIEVGMYLLATGQRVPVMEDNGLVSGDRVLLGGIEVVK
jgi:4-amino-4-deoxy-L-arabinose transferase-like glycosyltransferase